jgi:uncharacterized protein
MNDPKTELTRLMNWFRNFQSAIVAFSGGVDSTLVAAVASQTLGEGAVAVTSVADSVARKEIKDARALAKLVGIRHLEIQTGELSKEEYVSNPADRCYYCKEELYGRLTELSGTMRTDVIVDGTNYDDLSDHRPGLKAKELYRVRSPLAELKLRKSDVRALSAFMKLPTADKPASPCLSSRVAYGQRISSERLRRIEEAESFIAELTGVKVLRVRDHGEIVRVEVAPDERSLLFDEAVMDTISSRLRKLGFRYVTMDMSGYLQGSLNSHDTEPLLNIVSAPRQHG